MAVTQAPSSDLALIKPTWFPPPLVKQIEETEKALEHAIKLVYVKRKQTSGHPLYKPKLFGDPLITKNPEMRGRIDQAYRSLRASMSGRFGSIRAGDRQALLIVRDMESKLLHTEARIRTVAVKTNGYIASFTPLLFMPGGFGFSVLSGHLSSAIAESENLTKEAANEIFELVRKFDLSESISNSPVFLDFEDAEWGTPRLDNRDLAALGPPELRIFLTNYKDGRSSGRRIEFSGDGRKNSYPIGITTPDGKSFSPRTNTRIVSKSYTYYYSDGTKEVHIHEYNPSGQIVNRKVSILPGASLDRKVPDYAPKDSRVPAPSKQNKAGASHP